MRDAAYDGLLRTTRRTLHAKIVEVLERSFPALVGSQPGAGRPALRRGAGPRQGGTLLDARPAATRSTRSANVEAVSHLERGLQSLRSLPRDATTDSRELVYLVTLGPS